MLLLLHVLTLLAAAAMAAADVAAEDGTTGCGGCWCHCPVAHNILTRLGIALSGGSQDSPKAVRRSAQEEPKLGIAMCNGSQYNLLASQQMIGHAFRL